MFPSRTTFMIRFGVTLTLSGVNGPFRVDLVSYNTGTSAKRTRIGVGKIGLKSRNPEIKVPLDPACSGGSYRGGLCQTASDVGLNRSLPPMISSAMQGSSIADWLRACIRASPKLRFHFRA